MVAICSKTSEFHLERQYFKRRDHDHHHHSYVEPWATGRCLRDGVISIGLLICEGRAVLHKRLPIQSQVHKNNRQTKQQIQVASFHIYHISDCLRDEQNNNLTENQCIECEIE